MTDQQTQRYSQVWQKSFYLRLFIALALLYGVYAETGLWTLIFATLVTAHMEAAGWVMMVASDRVEHE